MKNIIIVGASRSGKTTLSKQIVTELGVSHFPFDAIVSTIEELYPTTGIKHVDDNIEMSKKISKLLHTFIKHMDYEDMYYLIDLYQIYPKDLINIVDDNFVVVYLGYPNIEPQQKLKQIKQHARQKDWTNDVSDEEMIDILKLFIKENKIMYQQCLELGIPFFDTSQNFTKELSKAKEYIYKETI